MYILGIQRNKLEWFNNDTLMGILTGCCNVVENDNKGHFVFSKSSNDGLNIRFTRFTFIKILHSFLIKNIQLLNKISAKILSLFYTLAPKFGRNAKNPLKMAKIDI